MELWQVIIIPILTVVLGILAHPVEIMNLLVQLQHPLS